MKRPCCFGFLFLLAFCFCEKNTVTPTAENKAVPGKNRYTTQIDGDTREYYVHVPSIYNAKTPTPVVIMLHGTSGDGERFYNNSGWKEVGEAENILTVYPSSWRYNIIDEGQFKNTTKWNIYPGAFSYSAGEIPRDDVKFLRQVVAELKNLFNVDAKRIYLAGFSNGGQMAFRCAVEMGDLLAAVVEASGSTSRDTTAIPIRDLPVTFQLGNSDDLWLDSKTAVFPMSQFEAFLRTDPTQQMILHTHAATFHFSTTFTLTGDTNTVLTATYPGIPPIGNRQFNIVFIKGLDHNYPNGINHWYKAAERNWAWFRQYALP